MWVIKITITKYILLTKMSFIIVHKGFPDRNGTIAVAQTAVAGNTSKVYMFLWQTQLNG